MIMYQLTIHPTIHRINVVYHQFGLWDNDDETVLLKFGKKLFHLVLMSSFVVALATGAYLTDNMGECIFLTAGAVIFFVVSVRLIFVLRRQKEISAFLEDIGVYSFTDPQEFFEMKKQLTNFFTYISYLLFSILIIGYCVPPISCLPIFSSDKRLPLNIGFPLNWRNSEIVYWIAFTYTECGIFLVNLTILNNLQVWYLMINYSIKYQMLGNKFKNLGITTKTIEVVHKSRISSVQKQNLFLQDLIKLIKMHRHITKTIEEFRDCFSNLFFVQIMTSAITICCMIYVLAFSSHENSIESVMFGFILIYSLLDIFTVTYFGNEIKLSSSQLSHCLFHSNWIDQSETCKKSIMILTEVLKQPQELVIFKLYPLNLETFTTILNLTYSMFNILQKFN